MQHRNSGSAGTLGCVVTLVALFVFAVVIGAGLAVGWGLVN